MVAELVPIQTGARIPKYRIVPDLWRRFVATRTTISNRNRRKSKNPLVLNLLDNKTVLVEEYLNGEERSRFSTLLYRMAGAHHKRLHMHYFDDLDKGVYKGLLLWMEDQFKFEQEHIELILRGRGFNDTAIKAWWTRTRSQFNGANALKAWEQDKMLVLYLAMNILENEEKWDY